MAPPMRRTNSRVGPVSRNRRVKGVCTFRCTGCIPRRPGWIRSKSGSVCCSANIFSLITLSRQMPSKPLSASISPITIKRPSRSTGPTPSRSLNRKSVRIYDSVYLAQTLLSDYSTLIILDNMETLSDARVMQFVRSLPPSNKSMILLTSRLRTSDWEKPLKVDELSLEETKNFLQIKTKEKNIGQIKNFDSVAQQIYASSGGLPLAIEWILGLYAIKGNLDSIINQVRNPDSPLLEFSFNIS